MAPEKIDRYEIIKELGRGGMASVYLARDPRFGREVAVKVLPAQFTHDPQFRARFDLEAKTIASLEHEAIVPVYDFGEFESQPYLVMRSMAGGSLAERIPKGGMPLEDVLPILLRIAPALDRAHQKGIIHRDLKPGNILFDSDRKAYIADFGVVKLAEATASLTMGVIGTPEYMSPEQGRAKKELDGRSDVYALGVVVYQLLTGQLPFEANTPAGLIYAHTHEPLPDIRKINRDVPKGVKAVLEKALAKDREARYPSAKAFALALARAASTTIPKVSEMLAAAPETEVVAVGEAKDERPKQPDAADTEVVVEIEDERPQQPGAADTEVVDEQEKPVRDAPPAPEGKHRMPLRGWLAGGGALVLIGTLIWAAYTSFAAATAPDIPEDGAEQTPSPRPSFNEILTQAAPEENNPLLADVSAEGGIDVTSFEELVAADMGISVTSIDWSPDGAQLAVGLSSGRVMIRDSATGELVTTFSRHTGAVLSVDWQPQGDYVASAGEDGTVQVWDPSTGVAIFTFEEHPNKVLDVEWAPDGNSLVSGGNIDEAIRIWTIDGEEGINLAPPGVETNIFTVAWVLGGNSVATSTTDGFVRTWSPGTGEVQAQSEEAISATMMTTSRDGNYILASNGGITTILAANDLASVGSLQFEQVRFEGLGALDWSQAHNIIAGGKRSAFSGLDELLLDSTLLFWDPIDRFPFHAIEVSPADIRAVAWSPDGERLATGDNDGMLRIWGQAP